MSQEMIRVRITRQGDNAIAIAGRVIPFTGGLGNVTEDELGVLQRVYPNGVEILAGSTEKPDAPALTPEEDETLTTAPATDQAGEEAPEGECFGGLEEAPGTQELPEVEPTETATASDPEPAKARGKPGPKPKEK